MKDWLPPESARNLGAGMQLAASVLLCLGVGYWADRKFASLPWGTLAGAVLGFGAGLYSFLKQFKNDDLSQ